MAHDSTLHVKLDPATNEQLSRLARSRKTSKGELVRRALSSCYSLSKGELPMQQRRALSAYEGGFISVGKLAEVFGMHVLDMSAWLSEHSIGPETGTSADDYLNA